jgi:hypothetical protein
MLADVPHAKQTSAVSLSSSNVRIVLPCMRIVSELASQLESPEATIPPHGEAAERLGGSKDGGIVAAEQTALWINRSGRTRAPAVPSE